MKIYLADIDGEMIDAWEKVVRYYGPLPVETHRGSILDLKASVVVSPANSFGFMDGGIDLVYSNAFGWGAERRLRSDIQSLSNKELLVGKAMLVEAADNIGIVAAPTMRTPSILPSGTINPYLATSAALLLLRNIGFPGKVAFPGMGTGCGRVPKIIAAWQMANAISEHLYGGAPVFNTWRMAAAHEAYLGRGPSFTGERRYWVGIGEHSQT